MLRLTAPRASAHAANFHSFLLLTQAKSTTVLPVTGMSSQAFGINGSRATSNLWVIRLRDPLNGPPASPDLGLRVQMRIAASQY
jgi:hypothetical protein